MKNTEQILNLFLFDGDGGAEGANASAEGGSGISAEAQAWLDSLGGGSSGQSDDDVTSTTDSAQQVVYGKDTQAGDDGGQLDVQQNDEGAGATPEEEFAELIGKGGKYHDLYTKSISDVVKNRFKNAEDLQGKMSAYDDMLMPLYAKYGLDVGDVEGMTKAIADDDDLYTAAAEEQGLTTDKYKENLRLQMDASKGRALMAEYQRQQEQKAQFAKWDAEAEALKEVFPNFDITQELANEDFVDALNRGYDVRDAFMRVHMEDILTGQMQMTQQQTRQEMVTAMQKKAARPAESGARQQAAVVRKADPSKLTDADMDRIFREVEDGKSFAF